jgi:hypothetical protein
MSAATDLNILITRYDFAKDGSIEKNYIQSEIMDAVYAEYDIGGGHFFYNDPSDEKRYGILGGVYVDSLRGVRYLAEFEDESVEEFIFLEKV